MFIIHEFQTTSGETAISTPITKSDRNEALSVFHSKCASAAISAVDKHCIIMLDEIGVVYERKVFTHGDLPEEDISEE